MEPRSTCDAVGGWPFKKASTSVFRWREAGGREREMGCRSPVIGFITGEIWSGRWSLGLRVGGLGEGSRIRLAVGAETAHERSRAEPLCLYAGRPRRGRVRRDALSRPTSCPGRQRSPSPCHGSGGWGGGRGKGAGCHPGGAEVGARAFRSMPPGWERLPLQGLADCLCTAFLFATPASRALPWPRPAPRSVSDRV